MQTIPVHLHATQLQVMQPLQYGRYQNGLVVQTLAQCCIDFDGAVDVPGFVDIDDFPSAVVALSATSVGLSTCMVLTILMMYRFIVPSGSGLMVISLRRATMLQSQAKVAVLSKSRARMASLQR